MKRTPLKRKARPKAKRTVHLNFDEDEFLVIEPQKKKKPKPLGHKQLWPLVSRYVRSRDKGVCFTCGKTCEGSNYHAGHFIPSAVGGYALRYHPWNLHGQCYHCNINLGGWGERYAERMEQKYGKPLVQQLRALNGRQHKIDWAEAIDYFKDPPIAHALVLPFLTEL